MSTKPTDPIEADPMSTVAIFHRLEPVATTEATTSTTATLERSYVGAGSTPSLALFLDGPRSST